MVYVCLLTITLSRSFQVFVLFCFYFDLFVFFLCYRQNHSTETALLKVVNEILLKVNNQLVTLPIFLDLSAAFDTFDHDTMLRRLEYSFGIEGTSLCWFASYLSGRTQRIMINESLSKPF